MILTCLTEVYATETEYEKLIINYDPEVNDY